LAVLYTVTVPHSRLFEGHPWTVVEKLVFGGKDITTPTQKGGVVRRISGRDIFNVTAVVSFLFSGLAPFLLRMNRVYKISVNLRCDGYGRAM